MPFYVRQPPVSLTPATRSGKLGAWNDTGDGRFVVATQLDEEVLYKEMSDRSRWDNPDAYDIFAPREHHLGFGLGPHQCLGMNVAQ